MKWGTPDHPRAGQPVRLILTRVGLQCLLSGGGALIYTGDALQVLRTMPEASVQCCVSSPPYWGLRTYGHDAQIGLERTPEEYVSRLVEVFREVRRVLKKDGTLFLNLGDSYATGAGRVGDHPGGGEQGQRWRGGPPSDKSTLRGNGHVGGGPKPKSLPKRDPAHAGKHTAMGPMTQPNRMPIAGLKPKDLVGAPWMVAFALRADGWWLRQDNVWNKPNAMPSSVIDRTTRSHEYVFHLSKSQHYYYNDTAILEPFSDSVKRRPLINVFSGERPDVGKPRGSADRRGGVRKNTPTAQVASAASARTLGVNDLWDAREAAGTLKSGRNKRSVWTIPTQPFKGAHFATMPQELVRICVLAGSRPGDRILDPFAGACTVGLVAERLGRQFYGIELNADYVKLAERRLADARTLFHNEPEPLEETA